MERQKKAKLMKQISLKFRLFKGKFKALAPQAFVPAVLLHHSCFITATAVLLCLTSLFLDCQAKAALEKSIKGSLALCNLVACPTDLFAISEPQNLSVNISKQNRTGLKALKF